MGLAESMEARALFDELAGTLCGRASCARREAPFPGLPATTEWRVEWENAGVQGCLVATVVEADRERTESSWIVLEDRFLRSRAWIRVASRAVGDLHLGERCPHRRGLFLDHALDSAFVLGLPPGEEELLALYGPGPRDDDVVCVAETTELLLTRCRPTFLEVLPKLQSLGDVVVEIEDGTISVRYGTVFSGSATYRSIIECANKVLASARAGPATDDGSLNPR